MKKFNSVRHNLLMLLGFLDLYPFIYRMDNGGPMPASVHSHAFRDYRDKHVK